MTRLISGLGVLLALLVMGVSAAVNARYGMSLAREGFDQYVMIAVAVFADLGKAVMWIFFMTAVNRRQVLASVASLVIFLACLAYAVGGSLGYVAMLRATSTASIANKGESAKDVGAELRRKQTQLEALGQVEPAGVIAKRIDRLKLDPRYAPTKDCTDIRSPKARTLCDEVNEAQAEEIKAKAAATLEKEVAVLRDQRDAGGGVAIVEKGDFQGALIAQLTSLDLSHIQLSLALLFVIVVEGGACFLLGAALNHAQSDPRREVTLNRITIVDEAVVALPTLAQPSNEVVEVEGPKPTMTPPAVVKAVRPAGDFVSFVAEAVELDEDGLCAQSEMAQAYIEWCRRGKFVPLSDEMIGQGIEMFCRAGSLERGRRGAEIYVIGVGLRATQRGKQRRSAVV